MTQTNNRFFDEIGRLMNDAAGAAQGVKREVDTVMRNQAERILRDLDLVKREEFEAVKDMARLAREENEALKARIAALEAKLGISPAPDAGSRRRTGRHPRHGRACPAIHVLRRGGKDVDARPPRPGMTARGGHGRQNRQKIPSFPCHFAPLGLKARHVRSPRTPGGLLRTSTGRDAAFNFLENKDLTRWRPSRN